MGARLCTTIRTSRGTAADLLCASGTFLAYTEEGEPVVNVCSLKKTSAPALRLLVSEAVHPKVTALHIGTRGSSETLAEKRLFASTRQSIHMWDIEECYAAWERGAGAPCTALDIPSDCRVTHLATDARFKWLAAVCDAEVLVYRLRDQALSMRLDGHSLQVNAVHFDTSGCERLITVSDDRTFKVWDLEERELAYQSSIYGAAPLTSLALDPTFPRMAVGSTNGLVRFFDLASPSFQQIQSLDIPLAVARKFGEPVDPQEEREREQQVHVVVPKNRRQPPPQPPPLSQHEGLGARGSSRWKQEAVGMAGISSVSALQYIKSASGHGGGAGAGAVGGGGPLLPDSPKVVAFSTQMLVLIDAYTYDLIAIVSFSHLSYRSCLRLDIDTPSLFAADNRAVGSVKVGIASAFTPVVHVVEVTEGPGGRDSGGERTQGGAASVPGFASLALGPGAGLGAGADAGFEGEEGVGAAPQRSLSVFPSSPPKRLSRLYQAIDKENKHGATMSSFETAAARRKAGGGGQRAAAMTMNKPVTFHSRVKSSGYGKIEPLKFLGKQVQSRAVQKKGHGKLKTGRLLKSYPVDCEPVHQFQDHHALPGDAPIQVSDPSHHSLTILLSRLPPPCSCFAASLFTEWPLVEQERDDRGNRMMD